MELKLTDAQFTELTKLYRSVASSLGAERAGNIARESAEMMMFRLASREAGHVVSAIAKK
jgi:hypothetical protein